MHCRDKEVVRLAHHAVCNVDDHTARNRLRFDPIAGFGKYFEAGVLVLRHQRKAFEIGVSADAQLIGCRSL